MEYTNFWLQGLERLDDFFVTWLFGAVGSLLVLVVIGGVLGLIGSGSAFEAITLFGLGILGGLGLAIKYSRKLPPMLDQNVTFLNGETRELIYACRTLKDMPIQKLVRVPFNDLAVGLSWGQIADHFPSFISVHLYQRSRTEGQNQFLPGLCLGVVDHDCYGTLPEDLVQKAQTFAEVLGAKYEGLIAD